MTSELTLASTTERADLDEQASALFSEHWPEYIFHDIRVKEYMARKHQYFADWDYYALDPGGRLLGACYGVPLRWDRTLADLPEGYTDSLARSVLEHEAGVEPDTLVVMGAVVRKDEAGKGVAGRVLSALRREAAERGLTAVIAPVRPTLKNKYPLADIDAFASWTRPDGLPLDPWLRTHVRLGATVLQGAPRSQTMTGTVADWQSWTGLVLPASGAYVIPDGLALLHVDLEGDHGVYHDPNVWMRHV
jgi:GNAT superfamily N-acetyltransferase